MEADQLGRLRDILEAARLIASYMRDTIRNTTGVKPANPAQKIGIEKSLTRTAGSLYDVCRQLNI
jgi:hypothetical protein